MNLDTWVLVDNKPGNSNQAIGLAEALGRPYILKKLNYNIFASLPNFLIGKNKYYINNSSSDNIDPPYPGLVISSGRRTAPFALFIKQNSPYSQIIQIMKPYCYEKDFDLIILPQHDQYDKDITNVYRTIGAINRINSLDLAKQANLFRNFYPQGSLKVISVFIGGNNKKYSFSEKDSRQFISILEKVSNNHAAQLFITFSRRTPKLLKDLFLASFKEPHILFDPAHQQDYNPYFGMMATGDFLVVTGDSISMCSEVATSGKPLYIYMPEPFSSSKHNYFIQQLVDLNIAKILTTNTEILTHYEYQPLREAEKAASFIKQNIIKSL